MTEEQTERNLGGRPKVNPYECNENWEEQAIAAYIEGKSDAYVRCHCFGGRRISYDLWERWMAEEPGFSESIKYGRELSRVWWEDVSQKHACGDNTSANPTSLIFNMCNRFKEKYKQRQTVDTTNKVSLDVDEMDKLVEFLEDHGVDVSKL